MPRIGVFWVYRGEVLGRSVALSEGESGVPGILDCPYDHAEIWENDKELLASFPDLQGQEYFEAPRGRVLWQTGQEVAIIYMDRKLFADDVKLKIAKFFDLDAVKIVWRTDPHYRTDP